MKGTKPFDIPKRVVWEAWLRVKANKGSAGVDGVTIDVYEGNLKNNLYRLWNRMSSGAYFPKAVRMVAIPKATGGTRELGIPTVEDRIAQTVLVLLLEPVVEPIFHQDSYGYRPGKSAHDAVEQARIRCLMKSWCIDLDVEKFFDTVDHTLLLKAVKKHETSPWMSLYVQRWLTAPSSSSEGELRMRDRGTPQGGAASPLLANLFLHYALDAWLTRHCPSVQFERYVDDVVIHCDTERQARFVCAKVAERLSACGLRLHPDKTKIVYCRDHRRVERYPVVSFDFLGFTFQPRVGKSTEGGMYLGYGPAISRRATKRIAAECRSWNLGSLVSLPLSAVARRINAIIRGWYVYYSRFYPSLCRQALRVVNFHLRKWLMRKYKRYQSKTRATEALQRIYERDSSLFFHWRVGVIGLGSTA